MEPEKSPFQKDGALISTSFVAHIPNIVIVSATSKRPQNGVANYSGLPVAEMSYGLGGHTLYLCGKNHQTGGKQSPKYIVRGQ